MHNTDKTERDRARKAANRFGQELLIHHQSCDRMSKVLQGKEKVT